MSKGETTRQFIIEKAAPIFNKKGSAGTAISDIMKATKLAKGGVYGNFENKEEICLEAFDYLTKSLARAIDESISRKIGAKDKLFALLDFYSERLFKTDSGGCPILNFGVESDDTDPVMKQRVNEAINLSQNRIANLVKHGMQLKEFKKSFDPELFAIKMFTMIEGAILISSVQNNNGHMKRIINILKAEIVENCN